VGTFDPARQRPRHLLLTPESGLMELLVSLTQTEAPGILSTVTLSPQQAVELRIRLTQPPTVRRPLHPLLARSTVISERSVDSYQRKNQVVAELGDWARDLRLADRHAAALEQAVDEMLLNALYSAPRDAQGNSKYAELSTAERARHQAPPTEQALVRFGCDAHRLVVAVRDKFGALQVGTVLRYLLHCAQSQQQRKTPLENKTSGAGVGLFLIATSASELIFRLHPQRCTELVFCLYRDRPRPLRALLFDTSQDPDRSAS